MLLPMLYEILVETVLLWVFHVTFLLVNTPKILVTVAHSRAVPSMDNSGNFVDMKGFLEVGWKIVHLVL